MTFSLNFCTEKSSTLNSRALFNSHISWILLLWVSRSAFSFVPFSSCSRTCSLQDSSYPQCASSNSKRWGWVCCWSSLLQVLRESTLHTCFMSSDLASASKWSLLPWRRDFATFAGLENLSWCLKENLSYSENVSWFNLFCLENTATSVSLLVGSWDELDIKFSRSESYTCDRSALAPRSVHEVVRRQSPIRVASRCFPLSHGLMLWSTGGRTRVWHVNPCVQWTDRLLWIACNPGLQRSDWDHNLQEVVFPSGATLLWALISAGLFRMLDDWFGKNVRKECPWCQVLQSVRHCATRMRCACFWAERRLCAPWPGQCRCMEVNVRLYTLTTRLQR